MTKPLRPLDYLEARNHSSSKGVGGDVGIRSQRQSIPLAPSAPKLWLFLDPLREFQALGTSEALAQDQLSYWKDLGVEDPC